MKQSSMRGAMSGLGAGIVIGAVLWSLPSRYALDCYAVGLALIAGIYLGSALSQKNARTLSWDAAVAAASVVLALLGCWVRPQFLVIGYLWHGVWDVLHEMRLLRHPPTSWWPLCCLSYDWVLAAFIYVRWVR